MQFFAARGALVGLIFLVMGGLLSACRATPVPPSPTPTPVIAPAPVQSVAVALLGETPPLEAQVQISGMLPDPCTHLQQEQMSRQARTFQISLAMVQTGNDTCEKASQPFTRTISLPVLDLPKGDYQVIVNGVVGDFTLAQDNVPPTPLPPLMLPAIAPPTATPAPSPTAPPLPAGCRNRVAFVEDVSAPDGVRIAPGQPFTKTWRLKNTGSCPWTPDYRLVFAAGEQLAGPDSQPLPTTTPPGQILDLSVALKAPDAPGDYTSEWLLQAPDGARFGLGADGKTPFWLKIRVPRSVPATAGPPGIISGHVWHDLCAAQQATADTLPPGCEIAPGGGVLGDGVRQPDEPPLVDVEVNLGAGACPATGLTSTRTDHQGVYRFNHLDPGVYCVSIDTNTPHNHPILIPGQWTHPSGGQQTITLTVGQSQTDVDFGWDYDLAP